MSFLALVLCSLFVNKTCTILSNSAFVVALDFCSKTCNFFFLCAPRNHLKGHPRPGDVHSSFAPRNQLDGVSGPQVLQTQQLISLASFNLKDVSGSGRGRWVSVILHLPLLTLKRFPIWCGSLMVCCVFVFIEEAPIEAQGEKGKMSRQRSVGFLFSCSSFKKLTARTVSYSVLVCCFLIYWILFLHSM